MSDWITEALERAERAEAGRWEADFLTMSIRANRGRDFDGEKDETVFVAETHTDDDLRFIAAARTDVPRLAKALLQAREALRKIAAASINDSREEGEPWISERQFAVWALAAIEEEK